MKVFYSVLIVILLSFCYNAMAVDYVYNEYIAYDSLLEPEDRNDMSYEYKVVEFADRDANTPKVACITRGRHGISCDWGGYNKRVDNMAKLNLAIIKAEINHDIMQHQWKMVDDIFNKELK